MNSLSYHRPFKHRGPDGRFLSTALPKPIVPCPPHMWWNDGYPYLDICHLCGIPKDVANRHSPEETLEVHIPPSVYSSWPEDTEERTAAFRQYLYAHGMPANAVIDSWINPHTNEHVYRERKPAVPDVRKTLRKRTGDSVPNLLKRSMPTTRRC